MDITVASHVLEQIVAEAHAAAPHECCGILLGQGAQVSAAIPAPNIHPTPQTHFGIDPQALVDAHRAARHGGPDVLGYYHSHPNGAARPSAKDQAMAAGDGRIWAIIAGDDVTFWRDDPAVFAPLSYRQGSA